MFGRAFQRLRMVAATKFSAHYASGARHTGKTSRWKPTDLAGACAAANSLYPGPEKRTIHKPQVEIGNSGSALPSSPTCESVPW